MERLSAKIKALWGEKRGWMTWVSGSEEWEKRGKQD